MAFSNCIQCGNPSPKTICNNCFAKQLSGLPDVDPIHFGKASQDAIALISSPTFLENERVFWPQVSSRKILEDCYYQSKLGNSFNKSDVSNLPEYAFKHIPNWFAKDKLCNLASQTKSFYNEIIDEQKRAQQALIKAKEEKKTLEKAELKKRAALDEKLRIEREKMKALQLADLQMKSRHYFNFATFPPFLFGVALGLFYPTLGFLGFILIICFPFLYRYLVSNIYFDTILKISNFIPKKILKSRIYSFFIASKILSNYSLDWAGNSIQSTSLIVYLYIVAGIGMVLGFKIISMIINYFHSIANILK